MRTTTSQVIIGVLVLVIASATTYSTFHYHSTIPITPGVAISASTTLQKISPAELARYDGSSTTTPIYIALDGYVYDVSLGRKFYQSGAVYHYLAGKDSSATLHIMGGETIKQKYPIIGIFIEK